MPLDSAISPFRHLRSVLFSRACPSDNSTCGTTNLPGHLFTTLISRSLQRSLSSFQRQIPTGSFTYHNSIASSATTRAGSSRCSQSSSLVKYNVRSKTSRTAAAKKNVSHDNDVTQYNSRMIKLHTEWLRRSSVRQSHYIFILTSPPAGAVST
jgi:hypothetical protein